MERLRGELAEFVADASGSLSRRDQRGWGECYLRGLMLDGRRQSIQPMAEHLPDANMQALQQFANQSPWDPLPVRQPIAERLAGVVRPEVWVIDDVSFPKCGKASAEVARQYCGAVRWAEMRWRIEHEYRELKHGLGLDHFEGRTWRGWHHHVPRVTAALAFLTLRRLDPKARTPA